MRLARNTAVLMKPEALYAIDSLPVPASDAILLRKFSCKPLDGKYVNVPEVRDYMGGSVDLMGMSYVSGSFEISGSGSGVAGTPTQWAKFLRTSAFAETITAGVRCDYNPISSAMESGSLYYYDDGVLKKALGMRTNLTSIKEGYGDVPIFGFNFVALDAGASAAANPALNLTNWKQPEVINSANSGMLTLGCTYSAGALVGGTTYPSKGIELSLGGKIGFTELLGGESVDFTDRDVTGKITLDLDAATEVANEAVVKAGSLTGIGMLHGSVAGKRLLTYLANVQLKNPTKAVLNGRRVIDYDIKAVPTEGTGNDELILATF